MFPNKRLHVIGQTGIPISENLLLTNISFLPLNLGLLAIGVWNMELYIVLPIGGIAGNFFS